MSLSNSDWLARSLCKMAPFTIHYCVARWSFMLLQIRPLPPYLPPPPFISTLLIFIPSVDLIVRRNSYGRRLVSTHPVAIARKPHDATIFHSSPDCHPYLLCCGDFVLVYLLPVRMSSTQRMEHQPRWNIFISPSFNQGGKIDYRARGGKG